MDNTVFEKVDQYIGELLAQEDQALKHATRLIDEKGIPNASISPNQGKLLQLLALASNARNILEIGTLGAYSTIWLARALPADGRLVTLEFDEVHAQIARENIQAAGLDDKVEVKLGKALDLLPGLSGPFDFIFIDADKPPYKEYFEWAIRLGRPGTIIVADNVIRNGKVLDENSNDEKVQGVRRLNQFLSECKDVTATILQTVGVKEYDGMVLAVVNHK